MLALGALEFCDEVFRVWVVCRISVGWSWILSYFPTDVIGPTNPSVIKGP